MHAKGVYVEVPCLYVTCAMVIRVYKSLTAWKSGGLVFCPTTPPHPPVIHPADVPAEILDEVIDKEVFFVKHRGVPAARDQKCKRDPTTLLLLSTSTLPTSTLRLSSASTSVSTILPATPKQLIPERDAIGFMSRVPW